MPEYKSDCFEPSAREKKAAGAHGGEMCCICSNLFCLTTKMQHICPLALRSDAFLPPRCVVFLFFHREDLEDGASLKRKPLVSLERGHPFRGPQSYNNGVLVA